MAILKSLALAAALAVAGVSAAPTPQSQNFAIIAARSTFPIHLRGVEASGGKFYIGRPTSTFCPSSPDIKCPPGNETVFTAAYQDSLAMDVVVPGGQQAYLASDGSLSFTVAHSHVIPPGSFTAPFTYTPGDTLGRLDVTAGGATSFFACPLSDGSWQVFADVQGSNLSGDCLAFGALTTAFGNEAVAWEYV